MIHGHDIKDLAGVNQLVPAGMVVAFAGSTAPDGWLLCDGSAVSRGKYSGLFSVIGTTYGSGDGSTTFNVPNLKGRVPAGFDSGQTEFDSLGETGGAKTVTLTGAQSGLPAHSHTQQTFNTNNNTQSGGAADRLVSVLAGSGGLATSTTGPTDASQSHTNLSPYLAINFLVKA